MTILGLGGLLDGAACAVMKNGELTAAVEETKIDRGYRPGDMPQASIDACLKMAGSTRQQVSCVAVARPFARGPESLFYVSLRNQFPNAEVVVVEHHQAHAASAFFASPFEEATVLTLDHSGDFRCGARWKAAQGQLSLEKEWYYPDSVGRFYSAVTELLGFRAGAEEHKVQWMSVDGGDKLIPLFQSILTDSARIDSDFLGGPDRESASFSAKFYETLGLKDGAKIPAALASSIARAAQKALEHAVVQMAGKGGNLCLAGGVFFNALLVEQLERCGKFKNVFVQPAAGNAGTALGAVFHAWHQLRHNPRKSGNGCMLLGPSFDAEEIKQVLENCKLNFSYLRSTSEVLSTVVRLVGERKIVAWMQGRMEFGPRALGNRSILASPLDPYSTENLNVYIKHREPSRKFAASVPAESAAEYFEAGPNSRHIATVGRVKEKFRKTFEGAILGGDMVRVHIVHSSENPLFHKLLLEAGRVTGLPVLYNTSFNLFGDPLVSTPRDAVRSFYSSGIDALAAGNFLLEK